MSGGDGSQVFLLDASALENTAIGDMLVDFAPVSASIDLSGMIQALLGSDETIAAEGAAKGNEVAVVLVEAVVDPSTQGVGHMITILYEDGSPDAGWIADLACR